MSDNPLTPERETTGNSEWTDTHADRFVASLRQEAAEYRLRHPQGESCQAEYALQLIDRLRASTVPIKTVAEIVGQIHTHIETPDDAAEAIRRLRASNEALREDLRTEVRNAAWESEQRQKAQEERDALRADHEATKRQLEISRNQTKDAFERVAREYNEKIAIRAAQSLPPGMTADNLDKMAKCAAMECGGCRSQLQNWAAWLRDEERKKSTQPTAPTNTALFTGKMPPLPYKLDDDAQPAAMPVQPPDLFDHLKRQWAWSLKTFGPVRRTLGVTRHIEKEIAEIREKPEDLSEWVDVIILAMDGYWRHGGKPEELLMHMQAKQDKNFARQWPSPTSEDEAVEHVRAELAPLEAQKEEK